jgi:hypothetical protein
MHVCNGMERNGTEWNEHGMKMEWNGMDSMYLSVYLPAYVPTYLYIYQSNLIYVYLCIHLSMHLCIYVSIDQCIKYESMYVICTVM